MTKQKIQAALLKPSINVSDGGDDMASMVLRSLSVVVVVASAVHSYCPHLLHAVSCCCCQLLLLSVIVYQIELEKMLVKKFNGKRKKIT